MEIPGTPADYSEHPFFIMEWGAGDEASSEEEARAWQASEFAETFSVDVFPQPEQGIDHRLVKYNCPGWGSSYYVPERARLIDTMSRLLTGTTFHEYKYEHTPPSGNDYVKVTYRRRLDPPYFWYDFVTCLRTYDAAKTDAYDFSLTHGDAIPGDDYRIPVYQMTGDYMDRATLGGTWPELDETFRIQFAANELRPDEVLLVDQSSLGGTDTYSQAIQLERGWNLVSWYVELPDPNGFFRMMDDVFREWVEDPPPPHYGDYIWLNPFPPGAPEEAGDRVGIYNSSPYQNNMYPEDGTSGWTWSMNQAYQVYVDTTWSDAHFWEYQAQQDYDQAGFPLDPDGAWDPFVAPTRPPNFWYFLSYPLRMQYDVTQSATIQGLVNDPGNPLMILKSDDGRFYDPGSPGGSSTLRYLEPGKGYFAGFAHGDQLQNNCLNFVPEQGSEPAGFTNPPKGENEDEKMTTSVAVSHFTFKARTHWWYPIVIDTVDLGEDSIECGDEIGVFDGDLCVGAAVYCDSFPIFIAAWKDDIASLNTVDGYQDGEEMTFVWYDKSENQEITFVLPPQTQAAEADPYFPTHSGFGCGFCARRSLADGIVSVNQLPQEFRLGQNYPNPFNAATIIPLELPQRSYVRIELYNVQGQNLGLIYEGMQDAGWPRIRYTASKLSSGVYFYRATAEGLERGGTYHAVSKMLVLK